MHEYASDCEDETHLAMTLKKQLFIINSHLEGAMITFSFSLFIISMAYRCKELNLIPLRI